ncbi:MAG: BamA/TamA family outer membrane protein [Chlamydiia bacterium]|nr:BamA/TamA family outer membrane protein [Chlamydiia bacterium]
MRFFLLLILFFASLAADVPYQVHFVGNGSKKIEEMLDSVSQLKLLQDHPPATVNALKRRAEADIPNLKMALQMEAYYRPEITIEIDSDAAPAIVYVRIETGRKYRLGSYTVTPDCGVPFEELGLEIGRSAYPGKILDAEWYLLQSLAFKGYPLARVVEREVIADVEQEVVNVTITVDEGPQVFFGPTSVSGLCGVYESVIANKIAWNEGCLYSPRLVSCTQSALEDTGLFAAVTITSDDVVDEEGRLTMHIEVTEAKHRTIGLGASYTTQLGPGVFAEWETRNLTGRGEKLSLRSEIWGLKQRGAVLFKQPDFYVRCQDLLWIAEIEHEKTDAFTEFFFSLSALLERQVHDWLRISYGGQFKELDSTRSNNNGTFTLLKAPVAFRFNNANNLLDPTWGGSLYVKLTPTLSVKGEPSFIYYIQQAIGTYYQTLTRDERWILALKVNLGSIFGAEDRTIPPPERFYAGNENTLRGYHYLTVSPLDAENKPIGGRSLMVYSAELRSRIGECLGWAVFYEVGNVYSTVLPQFDYKQLNSIGFGLRYHTAVGPLRADIGVPLNRRPGIDKQFELYFSIGQAF